MAGLLSASPASILYGNGNPNISEAQIRQFIKTPGITDSDVLNAALKNNIHVNQISNAMAGDDAYSPENIDKYLAGRGIVRGQANNQLPIPNNAEIPNPVGYNNVQTPTGVKFNTIPTANMSVQWKNASPGYASAPSPVKFQNINVGHNDTVQGQLSGLLNNTNSPLNVSGRTFANSNTNKRGMLNSSLNTEAAWKAMIDSSMPIAQQDASTNFASKQLNSQGNLSADSLNSQLGAQTNMFNADNTTKVNLANSQGDLSANTFSKDLQAKIALANSQGQLSADTFNNDLNSKVGMFNSDLGSKVGMFNNDIASRVNMFNTDTAANIYTANLDTNNKLAIANIQAMAQDSGIMGDLGKTYMGLYQQISADPNMTPDVKTATINKLNDQLQSFVGLLPSINTRAANLTFANSQGNGSQSSSVDSNTSNSSSNAPASAQKLNIMKYNVEPFIMAKVKEYERVSGNKVDPNRIAPEALVEDVRYGQLTPNFGAAYIGSDGLPHMRNSSGYDFQALMKQYGVKNQGELFDAMFQAVQPPGTMRADNPLFYVYR